MRILTYKRTHTGDPNPAGEFGINDCMGRVRNWQFDAVIGVGGTGAEARSHGIDGRVTWVGPNPIWSQGNTARARVVTFERFRLLDEHGPLLVELAPLLARRMYEKKSRVLLRSYSNGEKDEAISLISTVLSQAAVSVPVSARRSKQRCRPICKRPQKSPSPQ